MSKVNIIRKLVQALTPGITRLASGATRFAAKTKRLWKGFVNGKFASRFRKAASRVTEKSLGPVVSKQGRKSFAHRLRKSFIPGVVAFAKKHKKALLIGGSLAAGGGLLAWLLGKKGDSDLDLSELSESERQMLENEISRHLDLIDRVTERAVKVDYIKLSALVGRILRDAENGENVREADVACVLDMLAQTASAMFYVSPAARPYFITAMNLISTGRSFDSDYRLHNMRQVIYTGLASEIETNLDRCLESALRITDDLAFNDIH